MPNPPTLPDLLRDGLEIVFVGINPSVFSAAQGHYFARKINRFWPAFSRSRLSRAARAGLGVERLEPMHDRMHCWLMVSASPIWSRVRARARPI